ncbi:putative BAR adaptor protein RVS161 [Gongronella butleri]|nr:putative BAR adaptor protein RVS161 [Gongronella butleri]
MSFLTGFKKNLNRAGQSLMQKTGMADKTVDDEFSEEYGRFKLLEQKMEKLTKSAKDYQIAMRGVSASQKMMVETIEQFYLTDDPNFQQYKQTIEKLDAAFKAHVDGAYGETVMQPLARFCSYFPQVNEAVKRRQKKLIDYDTQRARVHKLVERSPSGYDSSGSAGSSDKAQESTGAGAGGSAASAAASRLSQAEQTANVAREMYEAINSVLINDLPKLVSMRVAYLDPSFEAFVKSQVTYHQMSFDHLTALNDVFPHDEHEQNARLQDVLQQMRELSICGQMH